jgi:hypothetical protein
MIESTDSFGNSCQRLLAPVGDLLIYSSAEVMVTDSVDAAPGAFFVEIQDEVLPSVTQSLLRI